MKPYRQIDVRVQEPYSCRIGSGLLEDCGALLSAPFAGAHTIALVSDESVAEIYADKVLQSLRAADFQTVLFTFPAGERSKNLSTLGRLLGFLASSGLDRSDAVAALGGGVTGDLAGFAAGVYLRGIRFAQLPTTLLAAVDSSVGGKTAVDLPQGKNLAGVFWQPSCVVCDTDCFSTLPDGILVQGAAEALKTGVLAGGPLFDAFENGTWRSNLPSVAADCVAYKADIVSRDEREAGDRRLLNLGHTFGHAIELLSRYRIPHGNAVAAGMAMMARAGAKIGWTSTDAARRIENAVKRAGLPDRAPHSKLWTPENLARAAYSDKKRRGESICLVVPESIGRCVLRDTPLADLEAIARAGMERTSPWTL